MAKYRHRIFEMYDFFDEALRVLTSQGQQTAAAVPIPESCVFTHLAASRDAGVTHIRFKTATSLGNGIASELHDDFDTLAETLERDSKVLFDFDGVASFDRSSINELILFRKKLYIKGSRMALCSLGPTVRDAFFAAR